MAIAMKGLKLKPKYEDLILTWLFPMAWNI